MVEELVKEVRFLKIYALISSALLAGLIFVGAKPETKARFGEIDVERINIVEPDGSLRMVISDKTRFPGGIIRGKEYPHDRQTAGVLFFNDEATENGGLIFGGRKEKDGTTMSYGGLSFDAYEQDEVLTLTARHSGGRKTSGMAIIDRPDFPIVEAFEALARVRSLPQDQQEAEWEKFLASKPAPRSRLYLGRSPDDSVGLRLLDTRGRERIQIQVEGDGTPVIKFLDAEGRVIAQLPPK
jgi:hypothetical protein